MDCKVCDNTGMKLTGCCSGYMCGCMGMPVQISPCNCGQTPKTPEEIESHYGEFVQYLEYVEK